jgi:hypothetical protein
VSFDIKKVNNDRSGFCVGLIKPDKIMDGSLTNVKNNICQSMKGSGYNYNTTQKNNNYCFNTGDELTIKWDYTNDLIEFYKNKELVNESKFSKLNLKEWHIGVFLYYTSDSIELKDINMDGQKPIQSSNMDLNSRKSKCNNLFK